MTPKKPQTGRSWPRANQPGADDLKIVSLLKRAKGPVPKGKALEIDAYLQHCRIWLVEHQVTPHFVASATKLSAGSLRSIWKQSWNPTVETLRRVELFITQYEAWLTRHGFDGGTNPNGASQEDFQFDPDKT